MTDWNYSLPWYHGAQQEITLLRAGSSISQDRDIARIFSHRPAILSQEDDGTRKHNGTTPGFLYLIDEEIRPEDVYPHPHPINESRWEWITTRELRVRLLERTSLRPEELLTNEEIDELRREYGTETTAG
jgi:hypothetical protein